MPDPWEQGYEVGAKLGTVFLGAGATWAAKAVDLSQEGTDMTANAASISESPATRYNVSHPRTIAARVEVDTGSSGTIYYQGSGGSQTSLTLDGTQTLIARANGAAVGSLSLPNVEATASDYEVAWVSEANPDTTGAADAVASWLVVWDVSNGEAARVGPFMHAAKTSSTAEARWGEDAGGGNAYSDAIDRVAFHERAMTLAELHNDWISAEAAPTVDATIEREALPVTLDSGIGDQNALQGPPASWAARSHRQLRRRTVTGRSIPLHPEEISTSYHVGNEAVRFAPLSGTYRTRLGWLWAIPVAPTVSHLWIRIHAHLWVTSGAAVPTGLRAYIANRPPELADVVGAEVYDQRYATAVVTRNDGAAAQGDWSFAASVPIMRGLSGLREGWAYVFLAYAIDPTAASGNDAAARLAINFIQIAPDYIETEGGVGFGGESG